MSTWRSHRPDTELLHKLKWLMFFRALFTTLLLASTIVLQLGEGAAVWSRSLLILYGLIIGLFSLSLIYSLILPRIQKSEAFAVFQVAVDTLMVSLIIYLTGGFSSIFLFLYLVVIIYAGILLFPKGSIVIAALCSIQYGFMVDLEYFGFIEPYGAKQIVLASEYGWTYVLYKVLMIMMACFAVAFLSGILAEQTRRSRRDLQAMETHVKRVEKMAAVGEMAAGLAHEIKNPLASLSGSIQILKDEAHCNPEHEKLMQIILREADRLSTLVNNFLLFAKPPAARMETIDLGKAISDTVEIFRQNLRGKDRIVIASAVAPDVYIDIDPDHLRQVLWNLILNAAEAIQGTGRIDIRMYAPKDDHAIVEIQDTGVGIPEHLMNNIFDPFVTTKPNGTGLGLSIVHRIVESYNCRMEVDSEEGQGSTFRIRFRRRTGHRPG